MAAGAVSREAFGSRAGFILAAAGSAVGLGNMWRFSYQASEGGGAAFVLLYIVMTILLLKVSGVALLEKGLERTKPAYRDYVARTSAFLPWPPKSS